MLSMLSLYTKIPSISASADLNTSMILRLIGRMPIEFFSN
jgi:hypothetical protein